MYNYTQIIVNAIVAKQRREKEKNKNEDTNNKQK